MTSVTTRLKFFVAGLALIAVALVCSLFSYIIGAVRIALIDGRQVEINFLEYFRRPTIDELLNRHGYDNLDVEAWRANRAAS